jgi:hypothetical protein
VLQGVLQGVIQGVLQGMLQGSALGPWSAAGTGLKVTHAACGCSARSQRMIVKDLGASRLHFHQFLFALNLVGEKRRTGVHQATSQVLRLSTVFPLKVLSLSYCAQCCEVQSFLERAENATAVSP